MALICFVVERRDGERNILLVFRVALRRDHDFFDLLGIGRRHRKHRCGHAPRLAARYLPNSQWISYSAPILAPPARQ